MLTSRNPTSSLALHVRHTPKASSSWGGELVLFDSGGAPVAYTENAEIIYLFTGEPVAYFRGSAIFGFSGKQLGWYLNGFVCDTVGHPIMFTRASVNGPKKPFLLPSPSKRPKQPVPSKCQTENRMEKPTFDPSTWSDFPISRFFDQ